jgi:hypothetical protein
VINTTANVPELHAAAIENRTRQAAPLPTRAALFAAVTPDPFRCPNCDIGAGQKKSPTEVGLEIIDLKVAAPISG